MANSYGEILTGRGGSYILNTTDQYSDSLMYAIHVLEDTKIVSLETTNRNGITTEVVQDHIADPASVIKAGAMITPMNVEAPFSSITLSQGSVTLILK
jgi:hypothetical protein